MLRNPILKLDVLNLHPRALACLGMTICLAACMVHDPAGKSPTTQDDYVAKRITDLELRGYKGSIRRVTSEISEPRSDSFGNKYLKISGKSEIFNTNGMLLEEVNADSGGKEIYRIVNTYEDSLLTESHIIDSRYFGDETFINFANDGHGNLIEEVSRGDGGSSGYSCSYEYNSYGGKQEGLCFNSSGIMIEKESNTFDEKHRITARTYSRNTGDVGFREFNLTYYERLFLAGAETYSWEESYAYGEDRYEVVRKWMEHDTLAATVKSVFQSSTHLLLQAASSMPQDGFLDEETYVYDKSNNILELKIAYQNWGGWNWTDVSEFEYDAHDNWITQKNYRVSFMTTSDMSTVKRSILYFE